MKLETKTADNRDLHAAFVSRDATEQDISRAAVNNLGTICVLLDQMFQYGLPVSVPDDRAFTRVVKQQS